MTIETLHNYESQLTSLHTNVQKGTPAPHKAILLLAIIDLIEEGEIIDSRIFLTEQLEAKFSKLWAYYIGKSQLFAADIFKPYFHMTHESFWKLIPKDETMPEKVDPKYSRNWIKDHYQYAQIDDALFNLLQNDRVRAEYRLALIGKYLVGHPIEHTIGKTSEKERTSAIGVLCSQRSTIIA